MEEIALEVGMLIVRTCLLAAWIIPAAVTVAGIVSVVACVCYCWKTAQRWAWLMLCASKFEDQDTAHQWQRVFRRAHRATRWSGSPPTDGDMAEFLRCLEFFAQKKKTDEESEA